MHKDIEPVEIDADTTYIDVPAEHFLFCFDLMTFALAPVCIKMGPASLGGYGIYCNGEARLIMEYDVLGWFEDRGMSHQSALDLLLAVNERNANRIV